MTEGREPGQADRTRRTGALRDDLWRLTLIGEHHDPWVCGPDPPFGIWATLGLPRFADLTGECQAEMLRRLAARGPRRRRRAAL